VKGKYDRVGFLIFLFPIKLLLFRKNYVELFFLFSLVLAIEFEEDYFDIVLVFLSISLTGDFDPYFSFSV
jgi:hypothetical protein